MPWQLATIIFVIDMKSMVNIASLLDNYLLLKNKNIIWRVAGSSEQPGTPPPPSMSLALFSMY